MQIERNYFPPCCNFIFQSMSKKKRKKKTCWAGMTWQSLAFLPACRISVNEVSVSGKPAAPFWLSLNQLPRQHPLLSSSAVCSCLRWKLQTELNPPINKFIISDESQLFREKWDVVQFMFEDLKEVFPWIKAANNLSFPKQYSGWFNRSKKYRFSSLRLQIIPWNNKKYEFS